METAESLRKRKLELRNELYDAARERAAVLVRSYAELRIGELRTMLDELSHEELDAVKGEISAWKEIMGMLDGTRARQVEALRAGALHKNV